MPDEKLSYEELEERYKELVLEHEKMMIFLDGIRDEHAELEHQNKVMHAEIMAYRKGTAKPKLTMKEQMERDLKMVEREILDV